jgi:hypothetical protein
MSLSMSKIKEFALEAKDFKEFSNKIKGLTYEHIINDLTDARLISAGHNEILVYVLFEILKNQKPPKVKK